MAEATTKTKVDNPLASGSNLEFASGLKGLVLISKVWALSDVGLFVDIPLIGKPLQRVLVARYCMYAFEKASAKMFNSQSLGAFNYRMRKDGIDCVSVTHSIGTDGAPISSRVMLNAKPHRAGTVLGNLLAKVYFAPTASDLTAPLLAEFRRDKAMLMWAGKKFLEALSLSTICVIGSKKGSVKASFVTKFNKVFAKAPKIEMENGPSPTMKPEEIEAMLVKGNIAAEYETKGEPLGVAAIVAQVASGYGVVGIQDSIIALSTEPELTKYAARKCRSVLESASKVIAIVRMYERLAERDKLNAKPMQVILAIVGVASGLPMAVGKKILSETPKKAEQFAIALAKISAEAKLGSN